MRPITALALIFAFAAAAPSAMAQNKGNRYRWIDPHGGVQYADSPTAEALQAGYDVIDARGSVVKHVDRVKSAEEKKADADAALASAQEKQRADDAALADRRMLQAYPSEQVLIDEQHGRIAAIDQDVANVKVSLSNQEKGLAEQLAYASTFEREGKPVPAPVKQQIEALRKNVEELKTHAETRLAERAKAQEKAQAELAHYRELREAQKRTQ